MPDRTALSDLIRRAAEGEPLWMPDLREMFSALPSSAPVVFHLRLITGEWTRHAYALPRWGNAEEKRFVQEFFYACVYNLLSACSGRELIFEYDPEADHVTELISDLDRVFQVHEPQRRGYGKVISIANRLCTAFGLPPFAFRIGTGPAAPAAVSSASTDPDAVSAAVSPPDSTSTQLPDLSGVICGIDIGGTDIKTVLAEDGRLVAVTEYDWNPAVSPTAEGILQPILEQVDRIRARLPGKPLLRAVGVSFPDVVIGDRILGGETPKTDGMRRNPDLDYNLEFKKIGMLRERLQEHCLPGAQIRIANDGNMAAFTAAVEFGQKGLFAHTLGTDLGSGWVLPDGSIPQMPLELYDLILDLGSRPSAALPPEDLRSTRNANSGLPGARRYLGQSAAFRLAWERDPSLLDGFTDQTASLLTVRTAPEDLRKPCLAHLMDLAGQKNQAAADVFRRVGLHLGVLSREADFLLRTGLCQRYLYGRFTRNRSCFELIREGCTACAPEYELLAPDDDTARTPLMRQLAALPGYTVAQFGQAVGAVCYAVSSA
ncbi:MAG: hypothetical protein K6C12_08915 [Oscillospiraceae bacterium]|nr:hypothetical protein [Oscillospiraceae bacterium]